MTAVTVEQAQAAQSIRERRRLIAVAIVCILIAAATFAAYVTLARNVTDGITLLPLDDAYIHLRYADQIAHGQLYQYNPGEAPTSGATSFLYPYLLAVGIRFFPDPLNTALWSMFLGAVAFAASGVVIYRIGISLGVRLSLTLFATLLFMINGMFAWHAVSGMETMLVVFATLLAFCAVIEGRLRLGVVAGSLCALMRPEGAILAVLVVIALYFKVTARTTQALSLRDLRLLPPRWAWRREWLLLLIPLLAILVQPVVNFLVTGSFVATGNSAKSLFGMIPLNIVEVMRRIAQNFVHIFTDLQVPASFGSGSLPISIQGIVLLPMTFLALAGLVLLIRRDWVVGLMIAVWVILFALAIATLDTAFWHFKRYQMPLLVMVLPLAAYGLHRMAMWRMSSFLQFLPDVHFLYVIVMALLIGYAALGALGFLQRYFQNVSYIYEQPYQMARALAAYPERAARIAVHDVGLMRYLGGLNTIDMVGLTTPGAADYWRNGPGSVGEFLENQHPDLIASYGVGHGLGLGFLADTDLYAETLAEFTVNIDSAANVALAADTQGIYRPDWTALERGNYIALAGVTRYLQGMELVDTVDVANLDSERAHEYGWTVDTPLHGFPTEYNQFSLVGCMTDRCDNMDGGRRISGTERFTIDVEPGQDVILLTRVHPSEAGQIVVFANGARVAALEIPALPGSWLDIPILIPAENVTDQTEIEIDPVFRGDYQPYFHRVYQGTYTPVNLAGDAIATMQDGAIALAEVGITIETFEAGGVNARIGLPWWTDGRAAGNLKRYIHVLDADGQIAAQSDGYPANGTLPPGNWLPGMFIEYVDIDITALPSGRYTVVTGLYDAATITPVPPTGNAVDGLGRIRVGEFEVD